MEAIGGYFSLELPQCEEYHKNAIRLNTGRNCLEYILRVRGYKKVYIPYYTCEVVLEPFQKLGIEYSFYHINQNLELSDSINILADEALLYTNYFGLKQRYVEDLASQYSSQLIVDNTQAFYAKPLAGIDTFYTCRKFFGVPDGAYLYTDKQLDVELEQDESYKRMTHLLKRIDLSATQGFADFRNADHGLDGQPIRRMSKLTHRLMKSIDYETIAIKRRANYQVLHEILGVTNNLVLSMDNEVIPMVYPYMVDKCSLREHLIKNKIFVAQYWPNVAKWTGNDSLESVFADQLIPLPIDQRCGEKEMNYMCHILFDK